MFIDQQGGRGHVQRRLCQSRRSIDTLFRGGWGERSLVKTAAVWNVYVSELWVLTGESKFIKSLHESSSHICSASVTWNELIFHCESCERVFLSQTLKRPVVLSLSQPLTSLLLYFQSFFLLSVLFSCHITQVLSTRIDVFLSISYFKKFWPPRFTKYICPHENMIPNAPTRAWGPEVCIKGDILISLFCASSSPLSSILKRSQHSLSEDVSNPKMHLEERGESRQ